ncbi:hypothetical protein [Desulfocicer niacini]
MLGHNWATLGWGQGKITTRHPHLKCLLMPGYTASVIARQGMLVEGVALHLEILYSREAGK